MGLDTQQSNDLASRLDQMIESGGLTGVVSRFDDPEGKRQRYLRPFSPTRNRPIGYFSNIGGMYPTIPAKWPPALVYAIMDGFLEHLGDIVDTNGNFGFQPMQMTGKLTHVAEYEIKFNDPFVGHRYGEADAEEKKITLQVPTDVDQILNQNITWDSLRSMGFQIARKGRRDNNTKNNECRAVAIQAITEAMRSEGVGQRDTRGNIEFEATEGVSVLELCYRIAEIATEKYNYNPRGDDFLFIMAMCDFSLREPPASNPSGSRPPRACSVCERTPWHC